MAVADLFSVVPPFPEVVRADVTHVIERNGETDHIIRQEPIDQKLSDQLKNRGVETKKPADQSENYDGHYRFAPIEEAQVSRAMIKRYVYMTSKSPQDIEQCCVYIISTATSI